jgi:hypothetical protein
MDVKESFERDPDDPVQVHLKKGTGGSYKGGHAEVVAWLVAVPGGSRKVQDRQFLNKWHNRLC